MPVVSGGVFQVPMVCLEVERTSHLRPKLSWSMLVF